MRAIGRTWVQRLGPVKARSKIPQLGEKCVYSIYCIGKGRTPAQHCKVAWISLPRASPVLLHREARLSPLAVAGPHGKAERASRSSVSSIFCQRFF